MDQQKRMLVALGLSFALTFVYISFFGPKAPEGELGADAGVAIAPSGLDAGVVVAPPAPIAPPEVAPPVEAPEVKRLERQRAEVNYAFSSEGAGLLSAQLQGVKMREVQQLSVVEGFKQLFGTRAPPPPQMDMGLPVEGQPLPLSLSIEGAQPFPASTRYAVEPAADEATQVVFVGRAGVWEIKKTFAWAKEGFELDYLIEVKNVSGASAQGELGLHFVRAVDPTREEPPSFFGGIGNQSRATCMVGDTLHHIVPGQEVNEGLTGPVRFVGIDQSYFLGAIYPVEGPKEGRCALSATPNARIAQAFFPINAAAGETVRLRFGAFIGPKDDALLANAPTPVTPGAAALVKPGLEKTIDFGVLEVICRVLLGVMKFFHSVTGNWGVAIILLTVAVKLVLLPLTHKSMVSAEQMKKLQPKMEELRKKYANDRERQNVEMMKLYQQEKVNPLGGCLPMLFQLPVWAALFTTLRASYELYREPFLAPLWVDLTYKDPIYFLPLALGVTMIITQRLQPQMMDATQAKIMNWGMPIFFTVIMLNYPAGLTLYIFTNNILSIGQQYALKKYLESKKVAA